MASFDKDIPRDKISMSKNNLMVIQKRRLGVMSQYIWCRLDNISENELVELLLGIKWTAFN